MRLHSRLLPTFANQEQGHDSSSKTYSRNIRWISHPSQHAALSNQKGELCVVSLSNLLATPRVPSEIQYKALHVTHDGERLTECTDQSLTAHRIIKGVAFKSSVARTKQWHSKTSLKAQSRWRMSTSLWCRRGKQILGLFDRKAERDGMLWLFQKRITWISVIWYPFRNSRYERTMTRTSNPT